MPRLNNAETALLEAFFENSRCSLLVLDEEGGVVFVSAGDDPLAPIKIGDSYWELFADPEDRARVQEAFGSEDAGLPDRLTARVGDAARMMEIRHRAVSAPSGAKLLVANFSNYEVADRERGADYFRAMFFEAGICMATVSTGGAVMEANPALRRLLGYSESEMSRMTVEDLVHPDDVSRMARVWRDLRSGDVDQGTAKGRLRGRNGKALWASVRAVLVRDAAGEPTHMVMIVEDETHAKRAEDERDTMQRELWAAQKMEAVGLLAGGIAHDFNNSLTAIHGYSYLAAESDVSDEVREQLEEVMAAGARAAALVRQLIEYSRPQGGDTRPIDVAVEVRSTIAFLRRSLPANIDFRLELDSDCGFVRAGPTQVQQILTNLCTNAAHAMPTGGVLRVSVSRVRAPGRKAGADEGAVEETMQILVTDTGAGIPSESRERVFEPFYTTKPTGKGTGLGLTVVRGITEKLGGTVTLQSEEGRGSSFLVVLPALRKAEHTRELAALDTAPHGANERVLVVEDDRAVAELLQAMLESLGYNVVARSTVAEGLTAFESDPESFDAVVTDLVLPHSTGSEIAWRVRRLRPDIPVLLVTGFVELVAPEDLFRLQVDDVLIKPFTRDQLAAALRRILDQSGAGQAVEEDSPAREASAGN